MTEPLINQKFALKRIKIFISRMPSLSTTTTKVLQICNSPTTSPSDLSRVISLDPVLTGNVLKLVNSAYYSLRSQVTTLTRAIIMLGLNTIKNLVLSTSILNSIGGKRSFQALRMNDFWTHSVCVGVASKYIAKRMDVPTSLHEEYFVAGLLHDLGKIPLNSIFPDAYGHVLRKVDPQQEPLFNVEKDLLGIDHSVVGKMIADKWQLSHALNDAICFHHDSQQAERDNQQMADIVALANIFSNFHRIGSAGDAFSDEENAAVLLNRNGLDSSTFKDLHAIVLEEIEKAKTFLQFTK
jgi:HD-like signal output (HDOD) protein